jgi:micrococcal nuclease
MSFKLMLRFFLLGLFTLANHAYAASVFTGVVSYVTDGDTLWVQPDSGGQPQKLRLEGIDAPEICQTGGEDAKAMLTQYAQYQRVEVTVRLKDSYGRGLARVRLNGVDLGAQMVLSGQAWSYRWRRSLGPYAQEESVARESRRGVFASAQAELPGDFRKSHGSCHELTR